MLKVRYTNKFKKDFKIIVKRGYDVTLFENVLEILRAEKPLPEKYCDHALKGEYMGHRECTATYSEPTQGAACKAMQNALCFLY